MFNPGSTYRLQFHKNFTFKDLETLIPYLEKLGVKTIYASPVYTAVPGSVHGYDGVNAARINPEIGTTEQLKELCKSLQEKGISWLQDIVPNHMAYHHYNTWLMDVLEKGKDSEYASFFDQWDGTQERIMAPFLGASLEDVIEKEELKIVHEEQKLFFAYYESRFPLNAQAFNLISQLHADLQTAIGMANSDRALVHKLAGEQFYELCRWNKTDQHINYRRFFTVNGLICLNIQHETVFQEVHRHALSLIKESVIQGLRIDHIDGLYEPSAYLQRLRAGAGEEAYIVVEKILEPGEALPSQWPIQGSTGYEFLALVNNLLTNEKNETHFTKFYTQLTGKEEPVEDQIYAKKSFILHNYMAGELENIYQLFCNSVLKADADLEDIQEGSLKNVIAEFLIHCPVYRFYGDAFPLQSPEKEELEKIMASIREDMPELTPALNLFEHALLIKPEAREETYTTKVLHFYKRCMQLTGPLMAKGVEDTLMYSYNRFIAHNEVGDAPGAFGISTEMFHKSMVERRELWPLAINATSTHDTKRGEDVRARLNVLTDLPQEWFGKVTEWQRLNAELKEDGTPDTNDEYFIYQTLIGTLPMPGEDESNFSERMLEYIPKALREAKVHSDWSEPNETYENATKNFIIKLLNKQSPFMKSFSGFYQKVVDHGITNSLSQLVLKHTLPGVPDTYQGTELWDLSVVDPDNRRPVDYERCKKYSEVQTEPGNEWLSELWNNRYDGRIKWHVTNTLLMERRQRPELFEKGLYISLTTAGRHKEHVFAFARKYMQDWCIVAIPLHTASLGGNKDIVALDWKDTHILLPEEAPGEWHNRLNGEKGKTGSRLLIKNILKNIPVAVLSMQHPENHRKAGVLLPISSLPAPYGVGDFGPEAKKTVDFLSAASQSYWQLLPLNPTEASTGHSPYSSISAMALNTLWISPDLLFKAGLLDAEDLERAVLPRTSEAMYAEAKKNKTALYKKAYHHFLTKGTAALQAGLVSFCEEEAYWLNDFVSYCILKNKFNDDPWFEWPDEYKSRNPSALKDLLDTHTDEAQYIKWEQFIAHAQWKELKEYASASGVLLFGDLPFYVSHDSADTWTNPSVFSLDEKGLISGVAGVPPDYFSETGQLWGMPTFKWEVLKQQNYEWWIGRLRKNLELFDLLRIDHFRALAEYWEVPAGEETAVNGKWLQGPGKEFFEVMEQEFGELPFVAEDLGDNMEKVYALREQVNLPGMKVLQFAFGDNLPEAVDVPHNFTINCIAYTGTHDNNTTVGWYKNEATKEDRKRVDAYTGCKVNVKNVHEVLAKMAYASVAKIAILPIQDILGLDEKSRMNMPGAGADNWLWRLEPGQLSSDMEKKLRDLTRFYNRR